jgi:hypothetical protein
MFKPYDFIKDAARVQELCKKAMGTERIAATSINKDAQAKAKTAEVSISEAEDSNDKG